MPGYDGLSLLDTVRQSAAIHPHWDAKQHAEYLIAEAGFDQSEVMVAHPRIVHLILEIRAAGN